MDPRSGRLRLHLSRCALALALVSGAGAASALSQTGEDCLRIATGPNGAEARFEGDRISYSVPFTAPNACYAAGPELQVSADGDVVTVRRKLERQGDICAQVLTEVLFDGEVAAPPTGASALVVEIESERGDLATSVRFTPGEECS